MAKPIDQKKQHLDRTMKIHYGAHISACKRSRQNLTTDTSKVTCKLCVSVAADIMLNDTSPRRRRWEFIEQVLATWRNQRVGEEELNAFAGKVHGKASWSRGLHISYAGYTADGLDGFSRGKRTSIICMEGLCLHDTLANNLDLARVIERKVRRAAETNEAFVPVRNLFPEVR